MAPTPKFQALTGLLRNLPPEVTALRVPFRDMEAMLGISLPRGAWTHGYWQRGTVARNNWERYGFTARFDRAHRTVLFSRRSPESSAAPPPSSPRSNGAGPRPG